MAGIALSKVCWRLTDAAVFRRVTTVLRNRVVFDAAVWGYGFLHGDLPTIREYVYSQSQPYSALTSLLVGSHNHNRTSVL